MPPQAKSSSMQVTNEERRWLLERRRFHKNQRDLELLIKRDSALRTSTENARRQRLYTARSRTTRASEAQTTQA
jgi:hypothetical protein